MVEGRSSVWCAPAVSSLPCNTHVTPAHPYLSPLTWPPMCSYPQGSLHQRPQGRVQGAASRCRQQQPPWNSPRLVCNSCCCRIHLWHQDCWQQSTQCQQQQPQPGKVLLPRQALQPQCCQVRGCGQRSTGQLVVAPVKIWQPKGSRQAARVTPEGAQGARQPSEDAWEPRKGFVPQGGCCTCHQGQGNPRPCTWRCAETGPAQCSSFLQGRRSSTCRGCSSSGSVRQR